MKETIPAARWANKPFNTFIEAIDAFRTLMSFGFFHWLSVRSDMEKVFAKKPGFLPEKENRVINFG